jgi:hypothetical protein
MEHRKGPQIVIRGCHRPVQKRTHRIHPAVPMCDHGPLRTRRCAAGVVDRQQIRFRRIRELSGRARIGDHMLLVAVGGDRASKITTDARPMS